MNEQWIAITGYEGIYEVSNQGNVRSVDRTIIMSNGGVKKLYGKVLKKNICTGGYYKVNLYDDNRKMKTWRTHTLVALHFLDPIEGHNFVNHHNGDKLDSTVDNLFWTTVLDNNVRGGVIHHKKKKLKGSVA